MKKKAASLDFPTWRTPAGEALSCLDKIKVLNENLQEIHELSQEALEDALLMGADETQVRATLVRLVEALKNPYRKKA